MPWAFLHKTWWVWRALRPLRLTATSKHKLEFKLNFQNNHIHCFGLFCFFSTGLHVFNDPGCVVQIISAGVLFLFFFCLFFLFVSCFFHFIFSPRMHWNQLEAFHKTYTDSWVNCYIKKIFMICLLIFDLHELKLLIAIVQERINSPMLNSNETKPKSQSLKVSTRVNTSYCSCWNYNTELQICISFSFFFFFKSLRCQEIRK